MSALISEGYRDLNAELHLSSKKFGSQGHHWAARVSAFLEEGYSVLDYGCGKRTLEMALGFPIDNYDPCIPGLDETPRPHAIVACTDVLEHIEPECIEAVLKHIHSLAGKVAILVISLIPAQKVLPDGRNAHICLQKPLWWMSWIRKYFTVVEEFTTDQYLLVVCTKFPQLEVVK